jgi:hypothetical protein
VPALVGVEAPQSANETHPVRLVGGVGVGRGDRDWAEVYGDSSKRATGESAPQAGILPHEDLLGGMVVGKDRVTERLEGR